MKFVNYIFNTKKKGFTDTIYACQGLQKSELVR